MSDVASEIALEIVNALSGKAIKQETVQSAVDSIAHSEKLEKAA
jgi:hypothetical protein